MDGHTHAVLAGLMIKKFYNAIYFSSSRKFVQKHTLSSIYSVLLRRFLKTCNLLSYDQASQS